MTDEEFVKFLLATMDGHLVKHSSQIAFLQLRVASEGFIVGQCALAVNDALHTSNVGDFRLYLEKHPSGKRPDLSLVPLNSDVGDSFIFEFKEVWPGWLGGAEAVKEDLDKWNGWKRAYSIVFLFCFDASSSGWPYAVWPKGWPHEAERHSLDKLKEMINKKAGPPFWEGTSFPLATEGAKGIGQLVAWRKGDA